MLEPSLDEVNLIAGAAALVMIGLLLLEAVLDIRKSRRHRENRHE